MSSYKRSSVLRFSSDRIRRVLVRTSIKLCALAAIAFTAMQLVTVCFAADGPAATEAMLPLPPPETLAAERGVVEEMFHVDLEKVRASGNPQDLIDQLRQLSRDTKEPALKFALLDEAERLAIEARMYDRAIAVATDKTSNFRVSDVPTRVKICDAIIDSKSTGELIYGIEMAKASIFAAIVAEDFDAADAVLGKLELMVRSQAANEENIERDIRKKYPKLFKSTFVSDKALANPGKRDAAWDRVFVHRRRHIYGKLASDVRQELMAVKARYEAAMKGDEASMAFYRCFDRCDWQTGIQLLARVQGDLGAAASADVNAGTVPPPSVALDLAKRWWAIAGNLGERSGHLANDAVAVQAHAAELYLDALGGLTEAADRKLAEVRVGKARPPRILHAVEHDAHKCQSAQDAVQVYAMFLANQSLGASVRRMAELRRATWKQRAVDGFRRYGGEWMSKEDFDLREQLSASHRLHAVELITGGQLHLAKEELDNASRLDISNGQADYLIGLINVIFFDNDLLGYYYLNEAAIREPDNGNMLCALANTECSLGWPDKAFQHYRAALEALPDQYVVNNVGVALDETCVRDDEGMLRLYNSLYRQAVHGLGLEAHLEKKLPFTFIKPEYVAEKSKKNEDRAAESDRQFSDEVTIGSGSGVVVAANLVLTNRHVVDGFSEVWVIHPDDPERMHKAKVIKTAHKSDADLALLQCDDLNAPAIELADHLSSRGEDIMSLGFPAGQALGLTLKSTKGAVVSLGTSDLEGCFLHSCIINPGNSGGPIVDQYGRLIGLVVAIIKTHAIGNSYSVGIPIELIRRFVDSELPKKQDSPGDSPSPSSSKGDAKRESGDDKMGTPEGSQKNEPAPKEEATQPKPLPWPKVDQKVSRSTVFIKAKSGGGGKK